MGSSEPETMTGGAPYLQRLYLRPDVELDRSCHPGSLRFLRDLDLRFRQPVTFFVGENGSGKSTLLEAIAQLSGLPVSGGGSNELADSYAPQARSELAPLLRAAFRTRPGDGYFFRAEYQAHFASLLERRRSDPDFRGDPYGRYGGRSLHARSHGEAFLSMFAAWMNPGLVLMDEPESALSPQRQLALLTQMAELVQGGSAQFIIASHSPLLMTFPGAELLSFDGAGIEPIDLRDTEHYQITRGMLEHPERYWAHLLANEDSQHGR